MNQTHLSLTDFNADNKAHYVEIPDAGFSPQRNYAVINDTIKEYEKMRYTVDSVVVKNAGDRADILASWTKYKLDEGGGKKLEAWLGKSWMSQIYGEKLMDKIKSMEAIKKMNRAHGNTKFENFYLT